MAKIFVGVLPTGAETFTDGADPVTIMLNDAIRAADAERAADEKARLTANADETRIRNTRRAMAMRRFRKALRCLR
jgi:hypothetical protein